MGEWQIFLWMCGACVHDALLSHHLEAEWPSDRFWLWIMVVFCSFYNFDHTALSVTWTQLYFVSILKGLWEFCSLFCNFFVKYSFLKIKLFLYYLISPQLWVNMKLHYSLGIFWDYIFFLFCKYIESPVSTQRSVYRIKHVYEPTDRKLCFYDHRQTTMILCLQTDNHGSVPTDRQLCFCAYRQICFPNLASLFHLQSWILFTYDFPFFINLINFSS